MLIVEVEGIHGSGLTTQADLLCAQLEAMGVRAEWLSLPRENALIGSLIAGHFAQAGRPFNEPTLQELMAAELLDLQRHLERLEKGGVQVCILDRYITSYLAYGRWVGFPEAWLRAHLDPYARTADLTIYLDTPIKEAIRRRGETLTVDAIQSCTAGINTYREVLPLAKCLVIVDNSGDEEDVAPHLAELTVKHMLIHAAV